MDQTLHIRSAAQSDALAIARVHVASWLVAYRTILPASELLSLSVEDRASRWEQNLSGGPAETLVAQRGHAIVGFASIGPSRDADAAPGETGELWALYADPEQWGAGVGWRLWEEARSRLIGRGYLETTLWVLEANQIARAFYERQGFILEHQSSQTIDLLGASVRMVRYRLGLRPNPTPG